MRSRRDLLRTATAVAGAAAVGAMSSGAAAAAASATGPRRVMNTVGTRLNTFYDASGLVTVSVFSHRGSPAQQHWIDETVLVGDGDVGGLVGIHCHEEIKLRNPVISIDGVTLNDFDFIDIGGFLEVSGAVPVVIKSLVFPTSAALGTEGHLAA